jgi:hypothetical protein
MSISELIRLLPESGSFLLREPRDLRSVVGEEARGIPLPQRIFLEAEDATPLVGFPLLLNESAKALRSALEAYVHAEEEIEVSVATGRLLDKKSTEIAWTIYRNLLGSSLTNAVSSSFGRGYPSIFWLFHSIAVSRVFKEVPKRIASRNSEVGRKLGSEIKYRIFNRFLDKVLDCVYRIAEEAAGETEESEEELFPVVLSHMRDNVLILTEDHISPDLRELDNFFQAQPRVDGRDFRRRLQDLATWHRGHLASGTFRDQIGDLLELQSISSPWSLLIRPGYARFLSRMQGYESARFFDEKQIELWEQLLFRLKEFELLAHLRRYVVPVRESEGRLVCPASAFRGAVPTSTREIVLSQATRPLDFSTPWVVDPLVRRFGLIYDITDFSSIVSLLRRSGSETQDLSFRRIFSFQRKVNKIARGYRLELEKYLGDGALYSGRHPALLLAASIRLQRHYRSSVAEDFPFDRGMRMALNYGEYRLLPIEGRGGSGRHRYEFFGHGIVELSRLVTGKSREALSEIKHQLITSGYDPADVEQFFEPLTTKQDDLLEGREQRRRFFAALSANGTLINEGIVATREFLEQVEPDELVSFRGLYDDESRRYGVLDIDDAGESLRIGVRRLGRARLKGLQNVHVFEVVDGEGWKDDDLTPAERQPLMALLDKEFQSAQKIEGGPLYDS